MNAHGLIVPVLALSSWASAAEPDWLAAERGLLSDHTQLTFPTRFTRAGEAYFSPDSRWVIFQAIPRVEGGDPPAHYSMYVAKLKREDRGGRLTVTGLEEPILVSPEAAGPSEASANTCGFFHPVEPWRVIFGSTLRAPSEKDPAGYRRGTSSYSWKFPAEMEVVSRIVAPIYYDGRPKLTADVDWTEEQVSATPIWRRDGYDAECAYSPDGRHIVYTRVDPSTQDADIYVYDSKTGLHRPLVTAKGYDGGPFFSPDGSMICYRSDRAGNDLLQVFIAELSLDEKGSIHGLRAERSVTSDEHVNWAPFWHPSGEYLVYTTSAHGHENYEIYAVQAPLGVLTDVSPRDLKRRRITHSSGFDGLPSFNRDGSLMMWTSQRGGALASESRPSSQLWIARAGDLSP